MVVYFMQKRRLSVNCNVQSHARLAFNFPTHGHDMTINAVMSECSALSKHKVCLAEAKVSDVEDTFE